MKFIKPASLLAALILAGCQSEPSPSLTSQLPPSIGPARGIDLPTDSSDVVGELKGFPINFVARYYRDPASRWPALSPAEAERLSALGLKIVTVWEWHSSTPAYFTYASGYSDALSASRQAKGVGQPLGSAIYFAVDFNARGSELWQIDQYFRGVNAGLAAAGSGRPEYKVGVYGSGAVCAAVKDARLAQYAWLSGSTSWDGTPGYSAWNIRQAPHGGRFPNLAFDHDANEAMNDYGGFQLANYAGVATPAAAVVSVAAAVPAAAATLITGAVTAAVPPAYAATAAPAPPAPPVPTAPLVTSVARAAPATPTQSPPPAPAAALAAATVPPPTPAAPASTTARVETAALEVAALAAAEILPRSAAAAEAPHASPRPAEQVATREQPPRGRVAEEASHERMGAHAANVSVAPKRGGHAVATNNRAAAVALRHAGASPHEPGRRTSTPRRAEDHGAHLQAAGHGAVRVLDRPARQSVEQRGSARPHRASGVPG